LFSKRVGLFLLFTFAHASFAQLLIRPELALELKYGSKAKIEKKNIALNPEQFERVKKLSKIDISEKIYTLYEVKSAEGVVLGYASLVTDMVRTHNQTILFFLNPDGKLSGAELIAYYEPPEYKVESSWLNKNLANKDLSKPLHGGDDLPIVTGSTLTVQSVGRSSRLALALWQKAFENSKTSQ
jgi:hypothetical protein